MSLTCSGIITFYVVVLLASNFRRIFYHSKLQLIHSKRLFYDSSTIRFCIRHSSTDYIEKESSGDSGSNSSDGNILFENLLSVEESKEELDFGITSSTFDFESIYTPEAISKSLEMMKVVDLKSFLRHLGGKYNRGDRKAAIIEQCYQYLISSANQGRTSVRNFASDSSQDKPDLPGIQTVFIFIILIVEKCVNLFIPT